MNFVLGGSGLIGAEIAKQFGIPSKNFIGKEDYLNWWDSSLQNQIYKYLEKLMPNGGNLFIAIGLVDPSLAPSDLLKANFELPKNIIQAAHKLNIRTHTFGTIQEYFKTDNSYLSSKRRLAHFLAENDFGLNHVHYRLHTLYGGKNPKEFMFLAKLSESIVRRKPFLISSGKQLREFHHVEDDVNVIKSLWAKDFSGVTDINHGNALPIGFFAGKVLSNFGLEHLVKSGFYIDPDGENYTRHFPKINTQESFEFRDPVSGFIEYQNSTMNS